MSRLPRATGANVKWTGLEAFVAWLFGERGQRWAARRTAKALCLCTCGATARNLERRQGHRLDDPEEHKKPCGAHWSGHDFDAVPHIINPVGYGQFRVWERFGEVKVAPVNDGDKSIIKVW